MTRITAREAQLGDVLLDGHGTCWQRGTEYFNWATFDGLVTFEGPWKASYGPQGSLILVVRAGKPVHAG